MDGLLVETESIHIRAFEEFMRRKGLKPSPGYAATLVGLPVEHNIEGMKRDFGLQGDTAALARQRNAIYLEVLGKSEVVPLPCVGELLSFAAKRGLKRAVCSSSEGAQLKAVLPRLLSALGKSAAPEDFFDTVTSGDGIANLKPAPDVYLRCAGALGIEPPECLALEDSLVGVQAAAAAGMPVVAVPNPHAPPVGQWPTPYVVDSLCEVLARGILRDEGDRGVLLAG